MIRFSIGVPPNLSFADYGRLAALVDRYAFTLLAVEDVPHFTSCWGVLFFLAQRTRRVHLGPSVTHPYLRHPLITAANVAALDEVSGGRAFLGIGRGDPAYHQALGAPMPRPVRALREAVGLIRQALAGKADAFRGEVFNVEPGFGFGFRPRRPDLPIYLGAAGPVGFRLVGELADGAHSPALTTPAAIAMARENVEAGARAVDRDARSLDLAASCWTSIGDDPRAALRLMKEKLAARAPNARAFLGHATVALGGLAAEEAEAIAADVERGEIDAAMSRISDDAARTFGICGAAVQAISRIEEMVDAGVRHIILKAPLGPNPAEAIRIIGEEVMPHFRRSGERAGSRASERAGA